VMERCSTDQWLQQETLCRRQWSDEYAERPEMLMKQNVVVICLQCLLVDIVHPQVRWRQTTLTFVCQNSDVVCDPRRSLQPVKLAEQWADVVES